MTTITFDPNETKYSHIIRLNNERDSIISKGHDITGIIIDEPLPSYIDEIHLLIGGFSMLKIPCELVEPGKNLLDLVLDKPELPISLAKYMYTDIMFKFAKDLVLQKCESYEVDEEIDEESYSDNVYVDSHDTIYRGRRVYYNTVKTGRKITKYKHIDLTIPNISVDTHVSTHKKQNMQIAFWDYITIYPKRDKLEHYIEKYGLKLIDGDDPHKAFEKGIPFKAMVKNKLYFQDGMCGKCITF